MILSLLESDRESTHTLIFSLLINTLLASLLSVFVEILCCKTKGPGTLSMTTLSRLGSSAFRALTQSSLCLGIQALLQAIASQGHPRSQSVWDLYMWSTVSIWWGPGFCKMSIYIEKELGVLTLFYLSFN